MSEVVDNNIHWIVPKKRWEGSSLTFEELNEQLKKVNNLILRTQQDIDASLDNSVLDVDFELSSKSSSIEFDDKGMRVIGGSRASIYEDDSEIEEEEGLESVLKVLQRHKKLIEDEIKDLGLVGYGIEAL